MGNLNWEMILGVPLGLCLGQVTMILLLFLAGWIANKIAERGELRQDEANPHR